MKKFKMGRDKACLVSTVAMFLLVAGLQAQTLSIGKSDVRGDLEWDYMMLGDSLITDYAAGRDTVTVDSGYTLYSKYYSNLGNAVSLTPALVSDSSVVVFWEIELANRDDGALVTTDFCRQYYLDWPSVNTTADSLTSTTAQVYLVPLVNAFVWRVKACLGVSINDPVQVGAKLTQWGGQ